MAKIPICEDFIPVIEFQRQIIRPILINSPDSSITAFFITKNGIPISSRTSSKLVRDYIGAIIPHSNHVGWASIRRIIPSWINKYKPIQNVDNMQFWSNYAVLANTSVEVLKRHYIRNDDSVNLIPTINDIQQILWGNNPEIIAGRNLVIKLFKEALNKFADNDKNKSSSDSESNSASDMSI